MCGFAGFIDLERSMSPADREVVAARMAEAVAHRGPDDADLWSDAEAGFTVAFRRLSIIDPTPTGRQPMVSSTGRLVIVFNGEIYNAPELSAQLAGEGALFHGHSDTEVMLGAFERWGIERTLRLVEGMFAVALWDRAARKLTLVRDRLGKKPLYYGQVGKTFFFGSQPKCFLHHPNWQSDLDRDSIAAFLRFGYVPSPSSIYKGIAKMRPAERIDLDRGKIVKRELYWDARQRSAELYAQPLNLTDGEAVDRLDSLLEGAVRKRLMADVPLGAFLSGGVDSSTVVAMMSRLSGKPVQTFCIGFEEGNYDESAFARAVAGHLKTEHHERRVTPKDSLEFIPQIPTFYDEPFADASQIPTAILSRFTRGHVTVALSGDGGDELFAGYSRYQTIAQFSAISRFLPRRLVQGLLPHIPSSLWTIVDRFLPAKYGSSPLQFRAKRIAELSIEHPEEDLFRQLVGQWAFPDEIARGAHAPLVDPWDGSLTPKIDNVVQRMQLIDTLTYLPDDILVKIDRAGMSVGLEVRSPLIDHTLVEFSWQLPQRFKIRQGQQKWLLRRLLGRYLPATLIDRPKTGFMIPLAEWLRGPLRDWAEDLLDAKQMESAGWLNPEPIRQRWQQHLSGQANWQYRLWCILMFESWRRAWTKERVAR